MLTKHIHIVSFNVPFPANYGGVIDVYYKIKWLHSLGIKVHLHCFEYGREEAPELNEICETVNYYPRKKGFIYSLHYLPFIVLTRQSEELVLNLMNDDFPILMEGLHTCFLLNDERLKHRFKIFRESNIEHEYYYHLFKIEKKFWQKIFYFIESKKLKRYESVVRNAQLMLVVSQSDANYFQRTYPQNKVAYLPSFHSSNDVESIEGKGNYVLYHGNLAVAENYHAATFIVNEIASKSKHQFIIAGLNPPQKLQHEIEKSNNVKLISNPENSEMEKLIKEAHINLLLTFQATGLKLKLLNVLFNGRFTLVNEMMLAGTGLDNLCEIANDVTSIKQKINELFETDFSETEIEKRKVELNKNYSNANNASTLSSLVFSNR